MKSSIACSLCFVLPAVTAACCLHATSALATSVGISDSGGHVDVLPFEIGGAIQTGHYDLDLDQVVEGTRLFVRPMGTVGPNFFGTTNPGFTTFTDFNNNIAYTLPSSQDLTFSVPTIPGSDAVSRNLLYWDGEGAPSFGAVQPGEDFFLRRSSRVNTALDGSGNAVNGFSIETINSNGEMHNHISFSARGVGETQPSDGFYLLAMQLEAGGLNSESIFFLFNADYERDNQGEILFNIDTPITNSISEQLAVDWVVSSLLTPSLPGDADGDGDIDDTDLGIAISNFTGPVGAPGGKSQADGDTDGDGDVDDTDLGVAISGFTGPLAPAAVPEPTSLAVLGAGLLLIARRRRTGC